MKVIAVVYWLKDGEEHHKKCYTPDALEAVTSFVRNKNYCYWICVTNTRYPLPAKKPRRHLQAI